MKFGGKEVVFRSQRIGKVKGIELGEEKQKEEVMGGKGGVETEEDNCVICLDSKADSVIMPCGHGGLCNGCAIELFSACKKCPICRSVSFGFLPYVFFALCFVFPDEFFCLMFLGYSASCPFGPGRRRREERKA